MERIEPEKMMDNIYYHGTSKRTIYSIMKEGFRLYKDYIIGGRIRGYGLYLSKTLNFAAGWGDMLVKCKLVDGTNILWNEDYDPNVIAYLKREFGRDIVKPDFHKVIPSNKHLTKKELKNLFSYLLEKHFGRKSFTRKTRRGYTPAWLFQMYETRIHERLKRHGYDAFGYQEDDWPEVMLFNPSKAIPVSAHTFTSETNPKDYWNPKNVNISGVSMLKQLFVTTLLLIMLISGLSAEDVSSVEVPEMVFCRKVIDRVPQEPDTVFSKAIGQVYCFTKVNASNSPTEITHIWYLNDKEKARVTLDIGSKTWRTWSSKRIPEEWVGKWRVDVEDPSGKVILSKTFSVDSN
ncbi:DUF2914 domain-containing protein [bacterium]|nr:DUF2914 domain-containing protein [bacterium]